MVNTTQHNACAVATKTADTVPPVRFANLSANQKAQARALRDSARAMELKTFGEYLVTEPLVDCWFYTAPNDSISNWGFCTRNPNS